MHNLEDAENSRGQSGGVSGGWIAMWTDMEMPRQRSRPLPSRRLGGLNQAGGASEPPRSCLETNFSQGLQASLVSPKMDLKHPWVFPGRGSASSDLLVLPASFSMGSPDPRTRHFGVAAVLCTGPSLRWSP